MAATGTGPTPCGNKPTFNLHKLCRNGDMKKIRKLLDSMEVSELTELLSNRNVLAGYTPLHVAVDAGHDVVADYLLSRTKGAHVNCTSISGYTSLHLAASSGHVGCVRVLLKHGADISITNEYGARPKQVAELCGRGSVVRLLRSEEIIKEVETNGENLTCLLMSGADTLEPNVLNRALIAATRNDNNFNAGKLIVKGAMNLEECLKIAKEERKPNVRAMLLLVKAAVSGNKAIVQKVFGETVEHLENPSDYTDDGFIDVQKAILSRQVSTVIPIEIARRNGQAAVREELLMHTDVEKDEGYVHWHGLRLLRLDISWLRKILWVKKLRLARNGFKSLPPEMGAYLKQVVKLDLQHNDLTTIPACLLKLPSLNELILSHNKLTELPQVPEWSVCLTVLNLSSNQLKNLPPNTVAWGLRSLNLSRNQLRTVPPCLCSFTALQSLDLGDNPDIVALPVEMGRLKSLTVLNLNNLKDLKEPPKNFQSDTRECIRYLSRKLYHVRKFFHMKLMVLGCADTGKTTLATILLDQSYDKGEAKVGIDTSDWRVDVNTWQYSLSFGKRKFHFSLWDFSGQAEYYALQKCFHSQHSLYLLLFNLTRGDKCIQELKSWLDHLASQAPYSLVIIVGTHLDQIQEEERENVDALLQRVGDLAQTYNNKLKIVEVIPVGLKNCIENIRLLKEAIYNHTADYKTRGGEQIMGQEIPASYHALYRQLEQLHQDVKYGKQEPIMHFEDFKTMVHQMSLADIQDDDDLRMATLFLADAGCLLHFDDCGHNLHELYFIDPCWLYNMMSKVVTSRLSKMGILISKDIIELYKGNQFLWKYFDQFIALLDRFEIALPLDNRRLLIPPLLVEERPDTLANKITDDKESVFYRLIGFGSRSTPPGFWGRLLSRLMNSIPQARFALDTMFPSNQKQGKQQFLPNSLSLPLTATESFDEKDILLEYWSTGLHYQDSHVMFRVESLSGNKKFCKENSEGVLIMTLSSDVGKQIFGQLVNLTVTLINQWYPGLRNSPGFKQRVPCSECMKQGRNIPYEFTVEQCLMFVTKGVKSAECGFFEISNTNHSVDLPDIVPDLFLQDIDSEFLLKPEDVFYQEDDASIIGKGAFAKVFLGKYHGKSVAIKKYIARDDKAFSWLHSEAKLLQQLHHPCIVHLVGVSMHPIMATVIEVAPFQSLELSIQKKKEPVHRLTIFRIAAQVAAALRFLHIHGIIFCDLNASNVLVWTLDPDSLCHCKLADFVSATHLMPASVRGVQGTKGFIAPEVLHTSRKNKQRSTYDHKADIFSFGMFLYQLIARRYPYDYLPPNRIDVAVELKQRPRLQDVDVARTGYHYLTQLMKKCWKDDPKQRPDTSDIIKMLSLSPMQSVMCVAPIRSNLSLHKAISITSSDLQQAGHPRSTNNELWVVCDGHEGTEINIYNTDMMRKVNKNFIKGCQTLCISLCGEHVWLGSRAGLEYGVLDIFNIKTRDLVHNIRMRENSVSCITSTEKSVYVGTLEGYCFSFINDISKIRNNFKPRYKYISEHAIDGIVATEHSVWVSHTKYIYLLNLDTLSLEGSLHCEKGHQEAFVGQLSRSPDGGIIWSAHLGGTILTAWDVQKQQHLHDIDTTETLEEICKDISEAGVVITAMTPALDCVWVGMATGHIMVYHQREMIAWYHPYSLNIRFLTCIPASGPCKTEKSIVVSGAKGFKLRIEGLDQAECNMKDGRDAPSVGEAGVVMLWEAYESKTMRQIKFIEEKAPGYLDSHDMVCIMIRDGGFKDGTHIAKTHTVVDTEDVSKESELSDEAVKEPYNKPESEKATPFTVLTPAANIEELTVQIPASDQTRNVTCPKPVRLNDLLSELQAAVQGDFELLYYVSEGGKVMICTQQDLDVYLDLPLKPQLIVMQRKV